MLVWGGAKGQGAAYDPASGRWASLPPSPIGPVPVPEVVWTGRQMLVWGLPESQAQARHPVGRGAEFDPATGRWTPLESTGGPAALGQSAVWAGSRLLVWGGFAGGGAPEPGGVFRLQG